MLTCAYMHRCVSCTKNTFLYHIHLYTHCFVACFHETLSFVRKLLFLLCMEMLVARPWGSLSLSEFRRACVFSSKNKKKVCIFRSSFHFKNMSITYGILMVLVTVNHEKSMNEPYLQISYFLSVTKM